MAVELLWVDENLYELYKKDKLTIDEYDHLCRSLAEEPETDLDE